MVVILFEPDSDYPIRKGSIPVGWLLTTVGEVVYDIRQGVGTGRHNVDGVGLPHLRPMNVSRSGEIALVEVKYVDGGSFPLLRRGDILFNNTNSAELVGKTAVFDLDGEWSYSNHMTRLRPSRGLSSRFVAYQFLLLFQEGYFRQRRTQHVGQASINSRTLSETIPFLLAPEEEQLRVVVELDRQFTRLKNVEEAINRAKGNLKQYEKLVVISAANGTLVSSEAVVASEIGVQFESGKDLLARLLEEIPARGREDVSSEDSLKLFPEPDTIARDDVQAVKIPNLPSLPEGWVWTHMRQIGSVLGGRQRAPKHHEGEHMRPYLRVANVFEDRIDTSHLLKMNFTPAEFETFKLEHGDILLNEGQSPELVGRPAMFRGEVEEACFQNTLIRFRAYHGISAGFALLVFRAYFHNGRFRSIARWTTNIAHLGNRRFAELEFPLPPLAEQERIVVEAARRLDLARTLSETIACILDRVLDARKAILWQAFTGKLTYADKNVSAMELLDAIRAERVVAESDQSATKRNLMVERPNRTRKTRTALIDVLREAGGSLTPEELLAGSGIGEDMLDEFFLELRNECELKHLTEERDGEGRVSLHLVDAIR